MGGGGDHIYIYIYIYICVYIFTWFVFDFFLGRSDLVYESKPFGNTNFVFANYGLDRVFWRLGQNLIESGRWLASVW